MEDGMSLQMLLPSRLKAGIDELDAMSVEIKIFHKPSVHTEPIFRTNIPVVFHDDTVL